MGVRGFGVAAVHCLTCDYAVGGWGGSPVGVDNVDNEKRRLVLRPERATQQTRVFKVLSILDTRPCDLSFV